MIFKRLKAVYIVVIAIIFFYISIESVISAEAVQDISGEITTVDRLFWKAYNSCDIQRIAEFITDDVEFYHDKDGFIAGKETLVNMIKANLCNNTGFRLRRVSEEGEQAIFPIHNYGAIMTGKHSFYSHANNQRERLDSTALFTHVWEKKSGQWKMSRIISYAHAIAVTGSNTPAAVLTKAILLKHTGHYQAAQTGAISVELHQSGLRISAGEARFDVLPESETVFFHKDSPLSFEFVRDNTGATKAMSIRENGTIVEEATRVIAR